VVSMRFGMVTRHCSIRLVRPWQFGSTAWAMPRRRLRWVTRTRSRQTNVELQTNLGEFCTLLHGMNKK
jgi:hypothetical protein